MKIKILIVIGIMACLCFSACSEQNSSFTDNKEDSISMSSSSLESSDSFPYKESQVESNEGKNQNQSQATTESEVNIFRYDTLPNFLLPNSDIVPTKITYYNVMLGETTEIADTKQINQIIELLQKVKIENTPTKKEDDAEVHQIISFYEHINDENPMYSLYFLVDSLYIETSEISSDIYPTLNWVNKGLDDETKINVQFRKLIDSWAEPSFPSSHD